MAIINKDKYLKDIAARVQRGAMDFEEGDRPELDMGGRKVYVKGVHFDLDRGMLAYTVCNSKGDVLPSVHGMRSLSELDIKSLSAVSKEVIKYHDLQLQRERNLNVINNRLRSSAKRPQVGINL